jgi:hypothetical protein
MSTSPTLKRLKYLAKKYHIEVVEKELTQEELEKQNERESLLVVSSYAARQFTENLFHTDEGISVGLHISKKEASVRILLRNLRLVTVSKNVMLSRKRPLKRDTNRIFL